MPRSLPPLPVPIDSWPPRPFDPAIVREIRAALEAYRTDEDLEATLRRIVRAVQRRPSREDAE